ncbi:MAG: pyridoxine 5'-phosphate synthase [Candidatus Omnitrophota bacterium]
MAKLGVNIDHVATIRQARGGFEPDPVLAARVCEAAGCDSIVCHLREDRRHINDKDLYLLRKTISTRLNMEMSISKDIIKIAIDVKPDEATLVPERRREVTTEKGLDCAGNRRVVSDAVQRLRSAGILVSLFIDCDKEQIRRAKETGAEFIELHTGEYANAKNARNGRLQLKRLKDSTEYALRLGLRVNAGHGLNYSNVSAVSGLRDIEEFNIGHSIVSRAVFVGLDRAVKEMLALIR